MSTPATAAGDESRAMPASRGPRTTARRAAVAMAGALLCAAAPWVGGPWAALRFFALCVAPGLSLLLWLAPETWPKPARAVALTLLGSAAVSPALLFLAARPLGGIDRALPAVSLFWGLLFAIPLLARGRYLASRGQGDVPAGLAPPSGQRSASWTGSLLLIAGGTLLLGLPLLVNADLRPRADAWTHIALVRRILTGPYPWTDPRFAGQPLRYFWMFNVWAAGFAARGGLSISWALVLVQLAGIAAFVAATVGLIRQLFADRTKQWAAAAVVAFAWNPLGFLAIAIHLVRALVGRHQGVVHLQHSLARLHFLDAGVHETLAPYLTVPVSWQTKFFVVTPFGLGMAGAVVALMAFIEMLRERRTPRAALVLLGLSFLAVCLHHLVAAVLIGLSLGGALVLARLLRRSPLGWKPTLAILGLLAAAAALSCPYLSAILAGRGASTATADGYTLGIEARWLRTAAVVLGPLLVLLAVGRRRLRETLGGVAPFAAILCALGLALLVFARFPTVNEGKVYILFFCLAAPFAAEGALALHRAASRRAWSRILWGIVLASAVAGPGLLWIGHVLHGEPAVPRGQELAAIWLRERTPPDAIVIEPVERQFVLNRAERDLLVSRENFVRECGYPYEPMRERLTLIGDLYAGRRLTDRQREVLRAFGRPVYAFVAPPPMYAERGSEESAAPDPVAFHPVYVNLDAAIYEFRPAGAPDVGSR